MLIENVHPIHLPLKISRRDWSLMLLAFVVSRIMIYAIGYFGAVHYNLEAAYIDPVKLGQAISSDIPDMFCQFDCGWFQSIADVGYDTYPHNLTTGHAANWAFMPGFPQAGYLVGKLTGLGTLIGFYILTNLASFLTLPMFFLCLRQLGQDLDTSRYGVWLLAFSPFSVYYAAPYTESSFLLFTMGAFLAAYRQRWMWVAVFGMLMAITRNMGVMVVFSVLILAWQAYGRELLRFGDRTWVVLLTLWLIPVALFSYMLYLYMHVGDAMAFKNVQLAWGRIMGNPFGYWWDGFEKADRKFYLSVVIALGWLMNGYLFLKKRYAEAVFMLICTLIPITTSTNAFPRYLFGLYPTLLMLVLLVRNKPTLRPLLLLVSAMLAAYFTIAWTNSKFFVV